MEPYRGTNGDAETMSMTWTLEKPPGGRNYLRTVSSGTVTAEDVKTFAAAIQPGQPFFNTAILSVMEPGTDFTPQARKMFGEMGGAAGATRPPTAVVVASAPMRVLISFVLKVSGAAEATRFFANEPEAQRWLFPLLDV
ncbi:MAG: hypothetical protein DI536_24585 [Archangium gephyra]|uniref:STAS/SEC14 domain-containing protein n=1 Tax=Archangium gephyra TaxID=48 RepID=A0A2W5SYY7_9BACT|nr:MAG: hypothetical protein DI536_24585 [Archangium gephyra]